MFLIHSQRDVCAYLLFELCFLLLHQLTLTPGLFGILQQLKHHSTNIIKNSVIRLRFYLWSTTGYLLLTFAKNTIRQSEKEYTQGGCTHKVSLSLLLFLNLFHHLSDSLQFGVHQLLLQLLVLEHLVYMLPEINQISIRLDDLWYALWTSVIRIDKHHLKPCEINLIFQFNLIFDGQKEKSRIKSSPHLT